MDSITVRTETSPIESKLNMYVVFSNHSLLKIHKGVFKIKVADKSYNQAMRFTDSTAMWCGRSCIQVLIKSIRSFSLAILSATALIGLEPPRNLDKIKSAGALISDEAVAANALDEAPVINEDETTANGITAAFKRVRLIRVSS